jgi:O-antigen ligase/tetratricopeptide (TPR) repeat protein
MNNHNPSKPKLVVLVEYVLLALFLCVLALRATLTEAPHAQSGDQMLNLGDTLYSLTLSTVLIFSVLLWFVISFLAGRLSYRLTGLEIGLVLLAAASVVACFDAGDKRAAITASVSFFAPGLAALVLVQILDSDRKIRLVLVVIAALAVVSAYQCADQFLVTNQMTIEQYEQDPLAMLQPLGMQPGAFNQFLFEHRLYSKGIHGFFTTSNSAGSFSLLAFFSALALFLDRLRNRKSADGGLASVVLTGFATCVVLLGLALTRSKGAIVAAIIAAVMFLALLRFGKWLNARKKLVLTVCLLLFVAAAFIVVSYGRTHNRLPGGSSMLVRWQYWDAAARMYADQPLTGIGPGNFSQFYPRYKSPAALETVADPHNFPLSLLTQYGPLGLLAFLFLVFVPLWRVTRQTTEGQFPQTPTTESRHTPLIVMLIISTALLFIRPLVLKISTAATSTELAVGLFYLYLTPVVAFLIGFWLFAAPLYPNRHATNQERRAMPALRSPEGEGGNYELRTKVIALSCAVIGCLIHNLIDFAIFEPPVLTTFFMLLACIIAADSNSRPRAHFALDLKDGSIKLVVVAVAVAAVWAHATYVFVPVAKTTIRMKNANQAAAISEFDRAHNLLSAASVEDPLTPLPQSLSGRLYLQQFYAGDTPQKTLLVQAVKCLLNAVRVNDSDFKNYEHLNEAYNAFADISSGQEKTDFLEKALDAATRAVQLYPSSDRLCFALAQTAEKAGKIDLAVEYYRKAVEIEDAFRAQFQVMYPDRLLVSRLGRQKYDTAKQKLKDLSQPTQ